MKRVILAGFALICILLAAPLVFSGAARVRLAVVGLKIAGRLPTIAAKELFPVLKPSAGFNVDALRATANPYAALDLPAQFEAESARGRAIFETRCARCHGTNGEGLSGPSLAVSNRRHGATDWAVFRVMQDGIPQTPMVATGLSFEDTWRVISHLHELGHRDERASAVVRAVEPVTADDIAGAEASTSEWLTYSGGWSGRRNKDLKGLTAESVRHMRLAWAFQLPRDPVTSETTPIVTRGMMIVTTAVDVIALNEDDGDVLWRYHREPPVEVNLCCTRANRGVAIFADLVFVGGLDAMLTALDVNTGRVRWQVSVGTAAEGYSITSPPVVVGNRLIVGVGGGEFGPRGFVDCYEAETGRRLWRTYTIPAAGEPGRETWGGTAVPAGAPTWVPGAYDPSTQTLYWGTGNPTPDFAPDTRPGDNLYSNSLLALDLNTGALKWHYQFTPNDSHDWDATQTPMLADLTISGVPRHVVLCANRNGFFYVLDRDTGAFIRAVAFAKQDWNDGFDAQGRPKPRASATPSPGGTVTFPGVGGAVNWWPNSFSPQLGLVFIAVRNDGTIFFRDPAIGRDAHQLLHGRTEPVPGSPHALSVVAVDAASGAIRWQTPAPESRIAATGGLISIGDRLVIGGQSSTLFALDAKTGARLWQAGLGAAIQGPPVAYQTAHGTRLVIVAGTALFVFEAPPS